MAWILQNVANEGNSVDRKNDDAANGIHPAKRDRQHFIENSNFKQLESRQLKSSEDFVANTLTINKTLCNDSN